VLVLLPSREPEISEYVLTWYCISPDGCEHADEAMRIDHATGSVYELLFTSTQDAAFCAEAARLYSDALPAGCSWLYYLSFFGYDLDRSMLCVNAGGFELSLSIPNEDAATYSQWVVSGRDVRFL
jgi:hypothetical protein